MTPKIMLTDGVFCPIPWTGLMYNFTVEIKNCIRSNEKISVLGNICDATIDEIMHGETNIQIQENISKSKPVPTCHTCYDLENGKKGFDIASDRMFYIKELRPHSAATYQVNNFDLRVTDIRWTNQCNCACVYCSPEYSSRWAKELNIKYQTPTDKQLLDFKDYIFKNAAQLTHVYMAGGEPLLMKQNQEFLELLKKVNPDVHLRINTNLSKTGTSVFDRICEFKNVHWTVSGESMGDEFNYIRYGEKWQDWQDNLNTINKLNHKISFNMLYFLLNYDTLFDTVKFLQGLGYHNNSFIIGPLLSPDYLNIRHLPKDVLQYAKKKLEEEINLKPGFLLEDSYKNLLNYITTPFNSNFLNSIKQLQELDQRRGLDSRKVFSKIYKLKETYYG